MLTQQLGRSAVVPQSGTEYILYISYWLRLWVFMSSNIHKDSKRVWLVSSVRQVHQNRKSFNIAAIRPPPPHQPTAPLYLFRPPFTLLPHYLHFHKDLWKVMLCQPLCQMLVQSLNLCYNRHILINCIWNFRSVTLSLLLLSSSLTPLALDPFPGPKSYLQNISTNNSSITQVPLYL